MLVLLIAAGAQAVGPTWTPLNGPPGGNVWELAVNPANDYLYAASYGGGIWRLSLTGTIPNNTWSGAAEYVPFQCVEPFTDIFPGTVNYILAGARERGLWRSTDGGATFTKIDGGLAQPFYGPCTVKSIAVVPTRPDTVYVVGQFEGNAAMNGIYRTICFTGPRDWYHPPSAQGDGFDYVFTDIAEAYRHYAYATRIKEDGRGGLYRTKDAGLIWDRINPDSLFDYFPKIAGFFQDPQALSDAYLTVTNNNPTSPVWRIYKIGNIHEPNYLNMTATRIGGWGDEEGNFNHDLMGGLIVNSSGANDTIWVSTANAGIYRKVGSGSFTRIADTTLEAVLWDSLNHHIIPNKIVR
jgi:hypothetical protein